ncbi:MAG: transporter [Prevotella sp.]
MNSIVRVIKNWTLPVAMLTGAVVYLVFANVPELAPIANWYAPYNPTVMPTFMFGILFVTFCKIDFHKLLPVKWHWWVLLQQAVFVFIVVGLTLLFHLQGEGLILVESLLACIIGPCAAAAAVVTAKLGGSLEHMTTYTFLSNFLTAILIPVCFPLLEPSGNRSFVEALLKILADVSTVLLIPMALAYIVKHYFHRFHRFIVGVKDLSYYLWGISLTVVTGTTVMNICHADTSVGFLLLIALLSLLLCFFQFGCGRFIGRHFNATNEAGQALGQKNTAFAIWIAAAYLNPLSTVGPGCYIVWQNTINALEIWACRRKGEEHFA